MKIWTMKNNNRTPLKSSIRIFFLFLFLVTGYSSYGQQVEVVEINGTVAESEGNAIQGAQVLFKNGSKSTVTDSEGNFSLETVPTDVLVIKTRKYETKYIDLQRADLSDPIVLIDMPVYIGEDDQVSLPYHKLSERMVTGAFSSVKGEELEAFPAINVANSLAGRIPGLHVSRDYGRPGWSEPAIYLRGLHRSGNNAPVIYVDGIEREISDLSAQEIESIHFLKDVTAKILAGPKAINGLLWIETKRGNPYQRRIDINVEHGVFMPTDLPEYLGSHAYAQLYNEARANDGRSPFYSQEDLDGYQNQTDSILYPDNDLYADFLKDQMPFTRISSQLSGGDDKTQYFINLSYVNSGGLEKIGPTTNYDEFKARANLDVALTDVTTMHLDINGRLEFREWNNMAPSEFFGMLSDHRPNEYPYFINDFERLDSARFGASYQYTDNVYGEATQTGYRKDFNRMGQVNLGLDFDLSRYLEGLSAKTYLMFDSYNYLRYNKSGDYNAYIPYEDGDSLVFQQVSLRQDLSTQSYQADDVYRRLGTYGALSYENTFNTKHHLQSNILARYYQTELKNEAHTPGNTVIALNSHYMYDNKYILEANLAWYGSPRFQEGKQYGLFPAFGAGWILSEESFLAGSSVVDFLKFKASWGIMGTSRNFASHYHYRDAWWRGGNYYFGLNNGNSVQQLAYINVANPSIDWERSREFNIGLKGLFFSERLRAEANYFNELRSGILVQRTGHYPAMSGNYLPYENYEEIANTGVEASLGFSDQVGDFSYSIGANVAFTRSEYKVVSEPDYPDEYMKQVGQPVDAQFGWVDEGLFHDQEAIDNAPEQMLGEVRPGDIRYSDLNGDSIINHEDMKKVGNWFPDMVYGLELSLGYKGLQLYVLGVGVQGLSPVANDEYTWVNGEDKYPSYIQEERWTPETAETATYPRLTTTEGSNNFRNSTFWVRSRDYFKIKNIELSYSLPQKYVSYLAMQEARIFIRGVNVMTFTPFERMNPESPSAGIVNWPLFRAYTGGVKFTF